MSEQAAIDEILKTPSVLTVPAGALLSMPCASVEQRLATSDLGDLEDDRTDFYESSFDLRAGLQVIERHVTPELRAAAFTGRRHYPVPR